VGPVLQLSMRRIHDLVAFCMPYEFEDMVAEVTGADRVEPESLRDVELARRVYKLRKNALFLTPGRTWQGRPLSIHIGAT